MNWIYTHNLESAIFKLGPIQPRWYAMMYILGFIATYFIVARHPRFKAHGLNKDDAMDLLTYGFVGVLAGGRLGYILFYNLAYYLQNPIKILFIWEGGMAFHGGLIGSIVALILYARKKKVPMGTIFDVVALPAPLGLLFGRLGNFINGELWGKPTDGSWGVSFRELQAGGNWDYGPLRHPTQLYEALLEGLLLFLFLLLATRYAKKLKPGSIGALFLTGYGCGRFAVEFWRIPDTQLGYLLGTDWLTMGHVLSTPMILGGLLMLLAVNLWGTADTATSDTDAPYADSQAAPKPEQDSALANDAEAKTEPGPASEPPAEASDKP